MYILKEIPVFRADMLPSAYATYHQHQLTVLVVVDTILVDGNVLFVLYSCEVIKDQKTGESLQYAFIEFDKVNTPFPVGLSVVSIINLGRWARRKKVEDNISVTTGFQKSLDVTTKVNSLATFKIHVFLLYS